MVCRAKPGSRLHLIKGPRQLHQMGLSHALPPIVFQGSIYEGVVPTAPKLLCPFIAARNRPVGAYTGELKPPLPNAHLHWTSHSEGTLPTNRRAQRADVCTPLKFTVVIPTLVQYTACINRRKTSNFPCAPPDLSSVFATLLISGR